MNSHVGADTKSSGSGSCFRQPGTAVRGFKPREQGRGLCTSSSFQPETRSSLSRTLPPNPSEQPSSAPWICQSFLEITPISDLCKILGWWAPSPNSEKAEKALPEPAARAEGLKPHGCCSAWPAWAEEPTHLVPAEFLGFPSEGAALLRGHNAHWDRKKIMGGLWQPLPSLKLWISPNCQHFYTEERLRNSNNPKTQNLSM